LEGRSLVTFHGRGFDLPVLELRSLKLGVPAPAHFASARLSERPGDVDLYDVFSKGGAAPAPLDLYAKLVGLPGKEDTAGKDVQRLYAQGDRDRIAAYCMTDVIQTWLLFLRWRLLEGTLSPQGYAASAASARDRLPALIAERLRPGEREILEGFLRRCEPFFSEAATPPLRRAL
jgi:predicted PolB exonuclease-like 3'-5' exonuclease